MDGTSTPHKGLRTLLAIVVFAGGIVLACLFRPSGLERTPAAPQDDETAARRAEADVSPAGPREAAHGRATTIPAPPAAPDWPPGGDARSPFAGELAGEVPASAALPAARTHKIVDGDTLPTLAQRYLGDARRAEELYEANRQALPSPELLPIGAVLSIPAGRGGGAPEDGWEERALPPPLSPRP